MDIKGPLRERLHTMDQTLFDLRVALNLLRGRVEKLEEPRSYFGIDWAEGVHPSEGKHPSDKLVPRMYNHLDRDGLCKRLRLIAEAVDPYVDGAPDAGPTAALANQIACIIERGEYG